MSIAIAQEAFALLGEIAAEPDHMDELRKACAELLGNDPATWPSHGNAPLAIAASMAILCKAAEPVQEPAPGYCKHCKQYTIEQPLFAAPPQRQPLLRGVIVGLWGDRSDGPSNAEIISFARAIERAQGIVEAQQAEAGAEPNRKVIHVGESMGAFAGPVVHERLVFDKPVTVQHDEALELDMQAGTVRVVTADDDDDEEGDLYLRLHSLSKSLEGSGRIDERDHPDAYSTVLDAMIFVRRAEVELERWEALRDPAVLHANLLRGLPARLSREQFLHLAGEPLPPAAAPAAQMPEATAAPVGAQPPTEPPVG